MWDGKILLVFLKGYRLNCEEVICPPVLLFVTRCRSSYAEKLNKLERTLDNAVTAAVTPTHIDTDSILSMPPEQLFTGSLRCSAHLDTCQDHSLAELYSRGPTPIVTDRPFRCSGRYVGRLTDVTPTPEDISDRETPVVTDTESRYSYVPLRNLAISSSFGPDRVASLASSICNTDSSTIIRELGLDNTETSPPRWYNPPPVKLTPSPDRQPCIDGKLQTMPLKTRPIETKEWSNQLFCIGFSKEMSLGGPLFFSHSTFDPRHWC